MAWHGVIAVVLLDTAASMKSTKQTQNYAGVINVKLVTNTIYWS